MIFSPPAPARSWVAQELAACALRAPVRDVGPPAARADPEFAVVVDHLFEAHDVAAEEAVLGRVRALAGVHGFSISARAARARIS